jgi:DNA-binding Lrp family transcriptional regulator
MATGTVPKPEEQPIKKPPQSVGLPKPDERQIRIWKDELRVLKGRDRRTRYEMGKRLSAIQSERAKAKVGTFTTVDLRELKIPVHTAYRLINFYKRIQLRVEANLLQFAKAQEKFPVEDVEDWEKHTADTEVDALNKVIDEEAARIDQMKKKSGNYAHDYRVSIHFANLKQLERFKKKWLTMEEATRSRVVYKAVLSAKNAN